MVGDRGEGGGLTRGHFISIQCNLQVPCRDIDQLHIGTDIKQRDGER